MIKKTWKELQESKLLWWINRSLHLFGWAIVVVQEEDGTISGAFPARVDYRGFSEATEDEGFTVLTKYLANNAPSLLADVEVSAPPAEPANVDAPSAIPDPQSTISPATSKYQGINPLAKLLPDEPFFFIRGRDIHAISAVRSYASMRNADRDIAGSRDCYAIAAAMKDWQAANPDKVKRPD